MLDAFIDQVGYRFRKDDAGEQAATWVDAENTNISVSLIPITQFRIRFAVGETNGDANVRNQMYWVQANVNGGAFQTLTEVDVGVGWVLITSPHVAHTLQTTAQMVSGGGAFIAGRFISENPVGLEMTLTGGNYTEWEYCVAIDPALFVNGDVFELRLVGDGDIPFNGYSTQALFTLLKPTVINFAGSAVGLAGASSGQNRQRGYTGDSIGVAIVQSILTWVGVMKGTAIGVALANAMIGLTRTFSGSVIGRAIVSAPLGKARLMSGAVIAVASITASFVTAFYMGAASAIGIANASAVLSVRGGFSGRAIGVALATAHPTLARKFYGSTIGVAVAGGILTRGKAKSGDYGWTYFGN